MYCIIFRGSVASCWPNAYSESIFFPYECFQTVAHFTRSTLYVHYIVQSNRFKHAAKDKLVHRVGSVEPTFTIYDTFTTPYINCNLEVSKEMRKKRVFSEKFARHWIFQMKFYTSFDISLRSFRIKEIRTTFSEHLTTRISYYNLLTNIFLLLSGSFAKFYPSLLTIPFYPLRSSDISNFSCAFRFAKRHKKLLTKFSTNFHSAILSSELIFHLAKDRSH